ncbi:uncharacterized protein LY89DRAFT_692641 [Mollisia scopiformis]|uniref:Uncharacterized protein n=1 Tax=Mollisia scopiformis TaxID=149040 RepID=A0A132B1E6_MOLSC|nr:uncharacterized protein LY89DRAFT_692641 [Mollisia scopiformis]KUJ06210.1 hypothetical protein LY89DRAFT_692641 [Mollisia scopiformis]
MHTSFAVPKNAESEPELFLILEVIDEIFSEAHSYRFHTSAAPGQKIRAFDPKKEPNTLKTNFGY